MARLVTRNWMTVLIAFGGLGFEHGTALKGGNTVRSDGAAEYCSGYTDKHGQWNNGFFCPKWGRPDQVYCCGPESHRYCCTVQREDESEASGENRLQVPLLAGLSVAVVLTLTLMAVALCYCCPCCVIYRRRKTRFADRSTNSIVDWHVTVANPVCCELSAPIQRPINTRIINPPPYDDKDAPPNYSSICKTKGPCPTYSSESAFRPYQAPAARGGGRVQDEAKQQQPHRRIVSPRLASLLQYQKPPQGVVQHRRSGGDRLQQQQQQHQSIVRCVAQRGADVSTIGHHQRENDKFVRVALSFKPLNTEATPGSRKTEGHGGGGGDHASVGLEDSDHQMSSYELLPLTSNAFIQ